jgi:hypothetical protein
MQSIHSVSQWIWNDPVQSVKTNLDGKAAYSTSSQNKYRFPLQSLLAPAPLPLTHISIECSIKITADWSPGGDPS